MGTVKLITTNIALTVVMMAIVYGVIRGLLIVATGM